MTPKRRLIVGIPLLLAVAAVAVFGMRWGLGSLELWRASQAFDALPDSAPSEPEAVSAAFERVRGHLDRARALRGDHPDQLDLEGRLFYREALILAPLGAERFALLDAAIDRYRAALLERPAWPYFWANLAVAKAERGIFDGEFRRALRRAVETGPWERPVQLEVIRIDFTEQRRIDRQSRRLVDEVIERALRIQPNEVLRLARQFGQLPRVCGLATDERLQARCARWLDAGGTG